jgi:hypothetical protein
MRAITHEFIYCKAELLNQYCKVKICSKIAFACLSLMLLCSSSLIAEIPRTVKVFALQPPDISPEASAPELSELKNPAVYGVSWRFRWKTIEPREGQYNWELIDQALQFSSNAGKKVILRVIAGMHTPEWVYQAGAKPFDFSNTDLFHSDIYQKSLRMPLPWDDVYLAKWEGFNQAFGKRYNGNPHVYSIPMSGGGHIDEMNLPKALEKWRQVGYSDEKLIAAWKRLITAYQKAFPNTPTNLAINEPLGIGRSNVLKPVVSYVLATYPQRVYLQQNGLKADLPSASLIRQIIRDASDKTVVGYQMVGGKGLVEKQTGDRLTAFRNALEDHVSYIEVYASDVRDPAQRRALQFLSTQSERR